MSPAAGGRGRSSPLPGAWGLGRDGPLFPLVQGGEGERWSRHPGRAEGPPGRQHRRRGGTGRGGGNGAGSSRCPFSVRPAAWGETGCHRRRQMESGGMSQSRGSPSPRRAARRRAMRGRRRGSGRALGPPAPRRAAVAAGGGGSAAAALTWRTALRARGGEAGGGRSGTGARAAPRPPFPFLLRPCRAREGGGAAGSAGSGSGGSAAALTWRIPAEGGCVVSSPSAAGAVPRGGGPVPAGRRCLSRCAPSWGGGEGRPRLHPSGRGGSPRPGAPSPRPVAAAGAREQ